MLVLTRRESERVRLMLPDGRHVWVQVVKVDKNKVRIGFDGPRDVEIDREEIIETEATK